MQNLPRTFPLPLPAEIVLRLDAMTYGGEALGRHEGKAIFVTGGLPGEVVRIASEDNRTRFARGRVAEVIEPAPDRITPRCPHFGLDSTACGGCQWQHVDYAAQLRYKTAIVREQVSRPVPADLSHRNRGIVPPGQSGYTVSGDWACPNRMPCAMA